MTTVVTPGAPEGWALNVHGVAPEKVIPQALILQTTSKAGFVEGDAPAVLVPSMNVDDDVNITAEGANITEADPDRSQTEIHTVKIAHLMKVSREQVAQPDALDVIIKAIKRAMIVKANQKFLTQPAPTAPATYPPAGLLAAANSTDAGEIEDNLDALVDAIAAIEGLPGGQASHIIASPESYAVVRKMKKGTASNESLVGAGVQAGVKTLLDLPVLTTSEMPEDQIVVVDKELVLSAYGDVMIARSDDFYFGSDNVALRGTFRFGVKPVDKRAVQVLTIPT